MQSVLRTGALLCAVVAALVAGVHFTHDPEVPVPIKLAHFGTKFLFWVSAITAVNEDGTTNLSAFKRSVWSKFLNAHISANEIDVFDRVISATQSLPIKEVSPITGDFDLVDVHVRVCDVAPERVERGEKRAAVLYIHGGGFVIGSSFDLGTTAVCKRIARESKGDVVVISVEYRLAPEHPFPAAVHDSWVVASALLRRDSTLASEWGIDPTRVTISGDSAGGNLSVILGALLVGHTEHSNDHHRPHSLFLVYPATMNGHTESKEKFQDGWMLMPNAMGFFKEAYLGQAGVVDPYVERLCNPHQWGEALALLPKVHIATASHDPLRDDGFALHEALLKLGVDSTFCESTQAHGFYGMDFLEDSRRLNRKLVAHALT